jgi:hypothetical protein
MRRRSLLAAASMGKRVVGGLTCDPFRGRMSRTGASQEAGIEAE